MADRIRVNTDAVAEAASKIKMYNDYMRTEFSDVEEAINDLNPYWDGEASESARASFFAIKNAYNDLRYNSMDNFVKFLHGHIGDGYETAETVNKKLADAFK